MRLVVFFFWLHWVSVAARGLSLVAAKGGYSSLWCAGFSLRWLLLLRSTGSRCAGFSSCGTWAQLLHAWDLPRPGLETVSPALAGRFLTTAPPGKSETRCLKTVWVMTSTGGTQGRMMAVVLTPLVTHPGPLYWVMCPPPAVVSIGC